ncbi:hypothetical protein LPJ67_001585 [Coemansia sp. RSA 1938]|nr:hypothetical protein LPJ67_001585 [Coemansia sp. RSA 1938]
METRASKEAGQEEGPAEQTPETERSNTMTRSIGPVPGLVLFSMLGVLIRIYTTRLFAYKDAPTYALIWPQILGCLIMGALTRSRHILSPSLYTGLTTGLCGSITTFSSWQLLVYTQFFNTDKGEHSKFNNFLGGVSVLVTTMACALGALRAGFGAGDMVCAGTRCNTNKWTYKCDYTVAVVCVLGVMAACVVVGKAHDTRSVSIGVLLGPAGTLVRWKLSKLNTRHGTARSLPIGTLLANIAGCAVLATVHTLQSGGIVRPSLTSCQVLASISDGFCGCITTISTFAYELHTLSPRQSTTYTIVSIVTTQCLFILICGIYFETAHVDYPIC